MQNIEQFAKQYIANQFTIVLQLTLRWFFLGRKNMGNWRTYKVLITEQISEAIFEKLNLQNFFKGSTLKCKKNYDKNGCRYSLNNDK